MAKQISIKKPSEFSLGVILNFIGIAALVAAVVLYLITSVDQTFGTKASNVGLPLTIIDLSLFLFVGGLSSVCIGAYMKKQQGLIRWQFLAAIASIIVGLAFHLIFILILRSSIDTAWVQSMCTYIQTSSYFLCYAGCYLLVRGVILSSNTFHANKCLKMNNIGAIAICVMLILNYVAQAYDDVGTTLAVWPLYLNLVANLCECFGIITIIYILLLTTRGFSKDWTKLVKLITLSVAILTALATQIGKINDIVGMTYMVNGDYDNLTNYLQHFAEQLKSTSYWCQTVFMGTFIPFSIFIMNWKNLAPNKVAY